MAAAGDIQNIDPAADKDMQMIKARIQYFSQSLY
jgi:hypothetical protein